MDLFRRTHRLLGKCSIAADEGVSRLLFNKQTNEIRHVAGSNRVSASERCGQEHVGWSSCDGAAYSAVLCLNPGVA